MIINKYKNLYLIISHNFICLLFSLNIFFWAITIFLVQLRFLIVLLIFSIFINFKKIIKFKILKPFLIAIILFLHLFFQSEKVSFNQLFAIFTLFLIFIILDFYKKFFFNNLNKIIYIFLIIFYFFIIYQYFSINDYSKSVGNHCIGCFSILGVFFKENSHLAFVAPSVVFYLLFISSFNKFINISATILFLFICFLNPSLTLYIGLLLLLSILLFTNIKLIKTQKIFLILIFFFLLFKLFTDSSAKTKVTDFFNENNKINLSTEVYKTSYLIAKNALFHKPLGYGFNNYVEAFNQFSRDLNINNKEVLQLNKFDASNNLSKIITEFGIFSLFFLYFLISFLLNNKIDNRIKIFLILPIIIQTFVRGAGYFNGGFLLFVFYTFILMLEKYPKYNSVK
jgi:hypothetical protein